MQWCTYHRNETLVHQQEWESEVSDIPSHCVCGQPSSVQHALSCPRGGFPSIRHNELCDLTASLLKETCHGIATEPSLQPITSETFNAATANTQDGARLDIVAIGFGEVLSKEPFLMLGFLTHSLLQTAIPL